MVNIKSEILSMVFAVNVLCFFFLHFFIVNDIFVQYGNFFCLFVVNKDKFLSCAFFAGSDTRMCMQHACVRQLVTCFMVYIRFNIKKYRER